MHRPARIVAALLCTLVAACARTEAAPPALDTERLCDRFIAVRWINADREIGAAQYELIDPTGHRRHVKALVRLKGGVPAMDYRQALVPFHDDDPRAASVLGRGLSRADEHVMRHWELTNGIRGGGMLFSDAGHSLRVDRDPWRFGESLTGGTGSVCIRHPDRQRTWIVELPDARHRYDDIVLRKRYAEVSRAFDAADPMRPTFDHFTRAGVIDVNADGLDDYPSLGVLSYRGAYHALRRGSDREQDLENFMRRVFDGNGASCEEDPPEGHFLVADGRGIHLNGTCDLTRLSGG